MPFAFESAHFCPLAATKLQAGRLRSQLTPTFSHIISLNDSVFHITHPYICIIFVYFIAPPFNSSFQIFLLQQSDYTSFTIALVRRFVVIYARFTWQIWKFKHFVGVSFFCELSVMWHCSCHYEMLAVAGRHTLHAT